MVIVDSASDGGTLIEKLARMTMDQSGEDLTGIDPCTGALHKSKIKGNDPNNTPMIDLKGYQFWHNMTQTVAY